MNLDLYMKTLRRGLTQVRPPWEKEKKKTICNKILFSEGEDNN